MIRRNGTRSGLDRRGFLRAGGFAGGIAAMGCTNLTHGESNVGLSVTADQPRVRFAHLPTALEEMPRLSDRLGGPRLLVTAHRNDHCLPGG